MDLETLGLDRNLIKAQGATPDYANSNADSLLSPQDNAGATGEYTPQDSAVAQTVGPGGIVTSVVIRSSDSANRVEIDTDDVLRVYNNNIEVVHIDKNGISAEFILATDEIAATTVRTNNFIYGLDDPFFPDGNLQPISYVGNVSSTGTGLNLPPAWTSARIALGIYEITHTLGLAAPYLYTIANSQITPLVVNCDNVDGDSFLVYCTDLAGNAADTNFNFHSQRLP